MPADGVLSLGPLSVPVWLLFVLAGGAVGLLIQRVVASGLVRLVMGGDGEVASQVRQTSNDLLVTALLTALVGWKLTPLVTRFPEIRAEPIRLLHYPGGVAGVAVGLIAAVVVVVLRLRSRTPAEEHRPGRGAATTLLLAIPVAAGAVALAASALIPSAPDLRLEQRDAVMLDGQATTIGSGKPTFVVFWATWCTPCGAQMPEVQRIYRDSGDAVAVYAVNLTQTEQNVEDVRAYVDARDMQMPVVLDPNGAWSRDFAVGGTPTNIVFGRDGRVAAFHVGAVSADWIDRAMRRAVRE